MAELFKINKKIRKKFTKRVDIKRTAQFHKRNTPAIRQAISELNPTISMVSTYTVLLEDFSFLSKTIVYQILIVSLPRSPQLNILLILIIEVSYLALVIMNYYRYNHLRSGVLFAAKLPFSIFLVLILILSAKFSISQGIERRGGVRTAVRPSKGLQITGVLLILGSVMAEYILLVLKYYLTIRDFCKKKKGGVESATNKVRSADADVAASGLKRQESGDEDQESLKPLGLQK